MHVVIKLESVVPEGETNVTLSVSLLAVLDKKFNYLIWKFVPILGTDPIVFEPLFFFI